MPAFDKLIREVHECTRCTLSRKRTNAVPGEGSLDADVMFVGEAPGYYEDRDGRPFVGRAGQLLDEMLALIGLRREEVYIANLLKCRPPNNRDPLPGEIEACRPYLDRQIEMIAPRVVVMLGRFAFLRFFPGETIGKARGKPRKWNDMIAYPVYHPAAALRNSALRTTLEDDFRTLRVLLDKGAQVSEKPDDELTEQLSFF